MSLERYLEDVGARLRGAVLLKNLARFAAVALLLSLLGAWYLRSVVPGAEALLVLRVVAYVLLGLALMFLLLSLRRAPTATAELERRVGDFAGRLRTYADSTGRAAATPLLGLLKDECEAIAAGHPAPDVVPRREWLLPSLAIGAALMALVLLLSPAAGHWGTAAQRLWLGGLLSHGVPRIVIEPGNAVVPRGFDVVVEAVAEGFPAPEMMLAARFENGGWQEARMSRLGDDRHGFVFVAVGEAVDYYVKARGVTSERYSIRVADLPRLESLALELEHPAWTGLASETQRDGAVNALAGTRVTVSAVTDKAVDEAYLVVNDTALPMNGDQRDLTRAFELTEGGSWHLAVPHEGELARISDRFELRLRPDLPPEVTYVWPGRDRQATAIEEVAMDFAASDDFGVTRLTLSHAVNGGAWVETTLDLEEPDYLLSLETLENPEGGALAAGDVVSFYLEVADHSQQVRSPLYFVDVRPFDRRYRESQQSGNSEGSGGDELDIAQRQKEILTATWNLINKEAAGGGAAELEREAQVVAMLQGKLREQVEVLRERASARSLDQEQGVGAFVEALEAAAAEMLPAGAHLEALELEAAVAPEQRALAHLRAAEASVRDISVSLAQDGRGRGTAGSSLSELVDLEMDQERNRYELPQTPNPGGSEFQAEDEDWQRLEELAARAEQRARQQQQASEDLASRWQLSRLERELEELRRSLESEQQSRQQRGQAGSASLSEAIASLEEAQRSLEQQDSREASGAAGRALRNAAESLRRQQASEREEQLGDARSRAEALAERQRGVMDRLEAAQARSLEDDGGDGVNPWQDFSMAEDAETKRQMRDELNDLRRAITDAVQTLQDDEQTASRLQNALKDLDDDRIEERLATAAEAFDMGRPLFVLGHEEIVRQGLDRLARQLGDAEASLAAEGGPAGSSDPLRAVGGLRQSLSDARGADGAYDRDALAAAAEQIDALRFRLAEPGSLAEDRLSYRKLGLNSDDPEALYRLARESLDLLEVELRRGEGGTIQAERLRPAARDSNEAADYYRRLGQQVP